MQITSRLGLLPVLFLVAACETSTDAPTPGQGPGVEIPPPGQETPGDVEPSCVAPTKGPTVHKGDVAEGEVWAADASPHIVENDVSVREGRTLTIEPCAEVQVAAGKHLRVAYPGTPNEGTLVAEGTAKRPITIHGLDNARWASVYVYAPGTARLAHVTLEGGGGGDFEQGASLNVLGDGVDGADGLVKVDHVTIQDSTGLGAWMQRGATFAAGSRDLVIRRSGSYPISISEHAIDALPTGGYSGNALDEILLDPEGGQTAGSGILDDASLHERGVPYRVGGSPNESLNIGGRPDGRLVTLTIEPGVVMKFVPGGALKVQHFTNLSPSTAALRALGTSAKPILMTSAGPAPAAGEWRGIWFGGVPGATNVIDHVKIEYAGADCGCILNTCSEITEHEGAIIFTAQPPSAFVTNTTFANVFGHGITQGYDGDFVDFRPTNTFEGVTGCAQTRPRDTSTTCPAPKPACD